ncbi:MAG: hypothetical protein KC713_03130 [Candidatus Omnitrophica bacterium]|nr:hypothetical protein [Candidatus Omnitrophota bacterium]
MPLNLQNQTRRRNDRLNFWLKERFYWWKSFIPVIFAHKPLCRFFQKDLLRIGPVHLCRSCVLLYLSMVLTVPAILIFQSRFLANQAGWVIFVFAVLFISYPKWYHHYSRFFRDVLRLALGAVLPSIIVLAVFQQWLTSSLLCCLLMGFKWIYSHESRKLQQKVCEGCPEYHDQGICSGFQLKSQRMRQYEAFIRENSR